MLVLALAPDLARKFGKDAIAAVEAAKGNVASINISGENKNPVLKRSTAEIETAHGEIARLEARVADHELPDRTRAELLRQIAAQKAAAGAAGAQREDARDTLATTPMRLIYSTEGVLRGISLDRTTWAALGFAAMLLNGLLALIVVLGTIAVPVGLILLGLAHGRRGAQRLWSWLAPRAEAELG